MPLGLQLGTPIYEEYSMDLDQMSRQMKQAWMKKFGNLHLAKEAVDLADHHEVMGINRARLKQEPKVVQGPNGPTVESSTLQVEDDEMRVGDVTTNNYPPPQASGGGFLQSLIGPLLAAALAAGAVKYMDSGKKANPEPDFVNVPSVSVGVPDSGWDGVEPAIEPEPESDGG